MDGTAAQPGMTASNPYGLPQGALALMGGLNSLNTTLNPQAAGSAQYMRPNPGQAWSQGTPNSLLATILQMRQNLAQGMGAPYVTGIAMPRVSLLNG